MHRKIVFIFINLIVLIAGGGVYATDLSDSLIPNFGHIPDTPASNQGNQSESAVFGVHAYLITQTKSGSAQPIQRYNYDSNNESQPFTNPLTLPIPAGIQSISSIVAINPDINNNPNQENTSILIVADPKAKSIDILQDQNGILALKKTISFSSESFVPELLAYDNATHSLIAAQLNIPGKFGKTPIYTTTFKAFPVTADGQLGKTTTFKTTTHNFNNLSAKITGIAYQNGTFVVVSPADITLCDVNNGNFQMSGNCSLVDFDSFPTIDNSYSTVSLSSTNVLTLASTQKGVYPGTSNMVIEYPPLLENPSNPSSAALVANLNIDGSVDNYAGYYLAQYASTAFELTNNGVNACTNGKCSPTNLTSNYTGMSLTATESIIQVPSMIVSAPESFFPYNFLTVKFTASNGESHPAQTINFTQLKRP